MILVWLTGYCFSVFPIIIIKLAQSRSKKIPDKKTFSGSNKLNYLNKHIVIREAVK